MVIPPDIKRVDATANIFDHYHANNSGHIYTNPELESRGLGFILGNNAPLMMSASFLCDNGNYPEAGRTYITRGNQDDLLLPMGIVWSTTTAAPACTAAGFSQHPHNNLNLFYRANFYFVKIGNSSQHATLPQNFTITLASFYLYLQSEPSIPAFTAAATWSISGFAAKVVTRTCTTPTASESLIDFGYPNQGTIQSMWAWTKFLEREFSFTFVCPRKAYDSISFLVEPRYGIEPAYPGTMSIAQGGGMAKGVGVHLFVDVSDSSSPAWVNVVYRTNPLSNDGNGAITHGKYRLFASRIKYSGLPKDEYYYLINGEEPTIQRTVRFKASLIRLPGPVQPGQIKAAALIHIRYN